MLIVMHMTMVLPMIMLMMKTASYDEDKHDNAD